MELVAVMFAIVAAMIGWAFTVLNMWAQTEREVSGLYDQLIRLRVAHPEVLPLSRKWVSGAFTSVYGQGCEPDEQMVIYYSYVELCISYCNAVLVARKGRRLNRSSYLHHHQPLVKLTLVEHYPIIEELSQEGKFISILIREFRDELTATGWNWREEHRKLAE